MLNNLVCLILFQAKSSPFIIKWEHKIKYISKLVIFETVGWQNWAKKGLNFKTWAILIRGSQLMEDVPWGHI